MMGDKSQELIIIVGGNMKFKVFECLHSHISHGAQGGMISLHSPMHSPCMDLLVVGLVTSTLSKWGMEPVDAVVLACFPTGGVKSTLIGPSIDPIAEELTVE